MRVSCPRFLHGRNLTHAGGEIWAAPAAPSRLGQNPATDGRANSLARLIAPDGSGERSWAHWWFTLLATDVNNQSPTGAHSCAPLPAGTNQGTIESVACDAGGDGLRLSETDGLLRIGADVCVSLGASPSLTLSKDSTKCASEFGHLLPTSLHALEQWSARAHAITHELVRCCLSLFAQSSPKPLMGRSN